MEHKMVSIADQIFEELEHDILTGKYEKGEILTEQRLCDQLGVSRTPVREALRRLEAEHIIESSSKGGIVIGITMDDIRDMCQIRLRLEGLASRWAAMRCDEEGIRQLREAVELQEFYTQKNDPDSLKNVDTRFHQCIYALCGSPSMRDTLEPLHRKLQKFRKVSLTSHARALESLDEHRAIYTAITRHDGDEAERLTTQHVKNAYQAILDSEGGQNA